MPIWMLWIAAVGPFVASLFYFVAPVGALGPVLYGATKVAMLVLPLVMRPWRLAHDLPRPARNGRSFGLGLAVGLVMAVFIVGMAFGPLEWLTTQAGDGVRAKAVQFGIQDNFLIYGVLMSLVHSAFEEYYWRWFLVRGLMAQPHIRRVHLWAAVAFSLHHMVVVSMYVGPWWGIAIGACVGFGGWTWSRIYAATGSLLGAWIAHIAADLAIVVIGLQLLAA